VQFYIVEYLFEEPLSIETNEQINVAEACLEILIIIATQVLFVVVEQIL